jgi:hypothetical protein
MIFVMVKCFLCGMDKILKYYLDELRLQSIKKKSLYLSGYEIFISNK